MPKPAETALVTTAPPGEIVTVDFAKEFDRQLAQAKAMREALLRVIRDLMKEGVHYGVMPGTQTKEGEQPKKSLFKAGAELLASVFHLRPEFRHVKVVEDPDFIHIEMECTIVSVQTDTRLAMGLASANTREDRFLNQCSQRVCPYCAGATIFKSKKEGCGWFCWEKKGGCGATFSDEDKHILDQVGTLNTNKVRGLHNTILQQASKRAMVSAIRIATACSDTFTQDMVPDPADDGDDDAPRQPQPRTQQTPRAAQAPRLTPNQVRDLSLALGKLSLGMPEAAEMEKAAREEYMRTKRLEWCNAQLTANGHAAVQTVMDLTPQLAAELVALAEKGSR
jgi:hypothetical protein